MWIPEAFLTSTHNLCFGEKIRKLECAFVKHYAPNCMLVPKLAACMIYLFHLNEVKFNFLKKRFGRLCFDLDPETECKLFADKFEMKFKFQNGVIL